MDLSKQVQRHKDLIGKLQALVESRKESLVAGLTARFIPRLEAGETAPDFEMVVRLFVRELAALQDTESSAEAEVVREAGDDPVVIKAQETAQEALYQEMTLLRSEVETGHGETGIKALGMKGTTPTRAEDLETYAETVVKNLLDEKVSLGESRSKRMPFNREGAAKEIKPLLEALIRANKDYTREVTELQSAKEKRAMAIDAWKSGAPSLGAALRALFVLSGDKKGAARIVLNPYGRSKGDDFEISEEDETPEPHPPSA